MATNDISRQIYATSAIPSRVLANWPVFFGFAVVDFGLSVVVQLIPDTNGISGMVIGNLARGMVDVTKFVAWETLKVASGAGAV